MSRKPTDLRSISTRLPEGLRRRLERSATAADRSMNAEIIHRLTESYTAADLLAAVQQGARDAAAEMFGVGVHAAAREAAKATMRVLMQSQPEGERPTEEELDQVVRRMMPQGEADAATTKVFEDMIAKGKGQ